MTDMKRGQHHGALKPALVSTAVELLDAEGIESVTIRAVARGAGVSHAAPVNHFADRRALLTAVATHCFEELERSISDADGSTHGAVRDRLFALIDAIYAYGLAHPNRYRLMWRQDLLDAKDPALKRLTDAMFERVEALLACFGEPGRISTMSRTVAICSAIHGYVLLRIDGNFESHDDEATGQPRHHAIVEALLP